ncbi:hypothetical protein KBD45_02655, partial [Candidatus Dojkabacteria bacterium]|nr:hypothetical protein [Candidatus Dojkabacteria bacterium]
MKFIRSFLLFTGLIVLIIKIFEDSTIETRKEVEKITIDFNPTNNTVRTKTEKLNDQEGVAINDESNEEEEDSGDEILEELEEAGVEDRQKMIKDLSSKLHIGENILSTRQMEILDVFKKKAKVDTSLLQAYIPSVTIRTLRRDLESLKEMGIIKKMGSTKGSYYVR